MSSEQERVVKIQSELEESRVHVERLALDKNEDRKYLEERIDSLKTELEEQKSSAQAAALDAEKERSALKERLAVFEQDLEASRAELSAMLEESTQLLTQLRRDFDAQLGERQADFEAQKYALQTQIDSLSTELAEAKREGEMLREQIRPIGSETLEMYFYRKIFVPS